MLGAEEGARSANWYNLGWWGGGLGNSKQTNRHARAEASYIQECITESWWRNTVSVYKYALCSRIATGKIQTLSPCPITGEEK